MQGDTIATRLAQWVVNLRYEDLPSEVVAHARRCMLDTIGVQIRGATLPWIQPVYRYVVSIGGPGEATITYHGDRLSVPYAAYANSAFSYSCELQHHGSSKSGHPGVVVIPAVQGLGEKLDSSGRELITAMVAGYEVQGRLGLAMFEPAIRRHFHPPGVLGSFSGAATAGKLLGLNEEQLAHAFCIAGSHASGIMEYDQAGGEVKRIHGAINVRNGIQSAFLAKNGFTGPPTVFEGRRGVFAAFGGGEPDPEQAVSNLGRPYCITQCRFRIYSTVGVLHTALDVLNRLATEQSFDYQEVESIRVGMPEDSIKHGATITRPTNVIAAQFSLAYSVGVRLVKGSNDLEMYVDPQGWRDPEVLSVADKVQPYPLGEKHAARVEIRLKGGRVLEGEQEDARGTPALPFTQHEIEAKFRRLAGVMLSGERVEELVQTVGCLEGLPSMSRLVPLLLRE